MQKLLRKLSQHIALPLIKGLAVDGTSGTVVATDVSGHPLHPALMYNDARAQQQAQLITQFAPPHSAVHSASSGLAKILWLLEHLDHKTLGHFANQSDWIVGKLSGQYNLSDHNNCLKMGYDMMAHHWPEWLNHLGVPTSQLPRPHAPGTKIAVISSNAAESTGLKIGTPIYAGTTDSTAAIYATGAHRPGDAITSLGSTLVTKVITQEPLFSSSAGVYSQPFGNKWLVGGSSNSGGNVLAHYFTLEEIQTLSNNIDPFSSPGLDYYPLISAGERFPICDPELPPKLTPRPQDATTFLHAILEGIANIEHQAYRVLAELGAPYPSQIYSTGGGSNNPAWTQIRAKMLGTQMLTPEQQDAAYGVAKIARNGHLNFK